MAEEHFAVLSVNAADPSFVSGRRIENRLHSLYPRQIVPNYNLIAFHRVPYAQVPTIRAAQESLLTKLVAVDAEARWDSDAVQLAIRDYLATAAPLGV